jgi:hypothetical protein
MPAPPLPHLVQVLPWQVDCTAVHHAVIQEQLVHGVASIVVLLNVLAATCNAVCGSSIAAYILTTVTISADVGT